MSAEADTEAVAEASTGVDASADTEAESGQLKTCKALVLSGGASKGAY